MDMFGYCVETEWKNQNNFQKSSKRIDPPPLIFFRKIMLQIVYQFHAQKALFKGPKSATFLD